MTSKKMKLFLLPFFLLIISLENCFAQDDYIDFGQCSNEELKMKECSFDKRADAVVLLDHAVASFNEDYNLITERRIRIKILKENGVERGNISIPFYSNDHFETIVNVRAVVLTPQGNDIVTNTLDKKSIFQKQVSRLYSVITFALPNIKPGSIIDYKYTSIMKSYAGLTRWEFQKEIPVITSFFELAPIPNSEFNYTVYKTPDLPIIITPFKDAGKVRFVMNNIPGLRDEVYAPSTRKFLQRVNFQFSSYTSYMGKKDYTNTWPQLVKELAQEKAFGSQIKKDMSGTPIIKSLPETTAATEKIKTILDFVRSNITWDHIYSKYSEDGVKSVFDKRKGNSGDINLLLVSLLKSAGLEAYPLLVSERENGAIDTTYSYLEQFDKVVAYVKTDENGYVLDGTDLFTPYYLVPEKLLNTIGFLVDAKKYGFVYFNNLPHRQAENIEINGTIKEDGILQGSALISEMDYAKLEKVNRYKSDISAYREALMNGYSFVKVDSFSVNGIKYDTAALTEQLSFYTELKKSGGYYLLNYNLFTGLTENPFITQYRFTDIDFGTKYRGMITAKFTLPPTLTTETLPAPKRLVTPNQSITAVRVIEKTGNQLVVQVSFNINSEKFDASSYDMVKDFFSQLIDTLNEPVLLKSK
jgi:transglutaminase-like putative cysteine protease